jgi:PAS domain S-box-containing protein
MTTMLLNMQPGEPEAETSLLGWEAQKTALEEANRLLRFTLDALSSHIAILDEHGTILDVNAAWNRFARENNVMGSHCGVGSNYLKVCDSASGSSDDASVMAEGIRAVIAGQRDEFLLEYPCHSLQDQRWFIVRATRFHNDGQLRVVVAHENITERKRAEETQQASECRHRLALHAGGLGAFEHTLWDNRILASSEFCQIFELPTQVSFSHDEWVEWMHPEDRNRVLAGVRRMLNEETGVDIEYRICLPNGDVRWIRAMASPIMEQGKVARVYGTVHDITQRKESECELLKLSRTAEQSPATATVLVPLEP